MNLNNDDNSIQMKKMRQPARVQLMEKVSEKLVNELAKAASVSGTSDVKIKLTFEVVKLALDELSEQEQLLQVLQNLHNFVNINRFEQSTILDKVMQSLLHLPHPSQHYNLIVNCFKGLEYKSMKLHPYLIKAFDELKTLKEDQTQILSVTREQIILDLIELCPINALREAKSQQMVSEYIKECNQVDGDILQAQASKIIDSLVEKLSSQEYIMGKNKVYITSDKLDEQIYIFIDRYVRKGSEHIKDEDIFGILKKLNVISSKKFNNSFFSLLSKIKQIKPELKDILPPVQNVKGDYFSSFTNYVKWSLKTRIIDASKIEKACEIHKLNEEDIISLINFSTVIQPLNQDILEEHVDQNDGSLNVLSHFLLHNLVNSRPFDDELIDRILELLAKVGNKQNEEFIDQSQLLQATKQLQASSFLLKLHQHPQAIELVQKISKNKQTPSVQSFYSQSKHEDLQIYWASILFEEYMNPRYQGEIPTQRYTVKKDISLQKGSLHLTNIKSHSLHIENSDQDILFYIYKPEDEMFTFVTDQETMQNGPSNIIQFMHKLLNEQIVGTKLLYIDAQDSKMKNDLILRHEIGGKDTFTMRELLFQLEQAEDVENEKANS